VTAERGVPRVKLYSPEGELLALIAGPERFAANEAASNRDDGVGCHTGGLDVAVDSHDRVLVLDRVTGQVRIFA
jgi:hypothetical protein